MSILPHHLEWDANSETQSGQPGDITASAFKLTYLRTIAGL